MTQQAIPARSIHNLMGYGYRLRIPHGPGEPMLVDADAAKHGRKAGPSYTVSIAEVRSLFKTGVITKLTEFGEGQRLGWRSAGYDGDVADWWVCTQ